MSPVALRPTRVRTRLLAVVLVPLVAFALVASSTVRVSETRAGRARAAQRAIARFLVVDRLALRLRVERELAVLLVRARTAGADRNAVTALVGVDVEHSYDRARSATDGVLADLRSQALADDTVRLVNVTRPPVATWSGDAVAIAATYAVGVRSAEKASLVGGAGAEAALASLGGAADLSALVTSVEYLDNYHRSSAAELDDLARLAVPVAGETAVVDERQSSYTAEQSMIGGLLSDELPPEQQGTWHDLRTSGAFTGFARLHGDLVDDHPASGRQPETGALARLLGMGIERSDALMTFTGTLGDVLTTATDRIDANATADAAHLVMLVAVLAIAALALAAMATRSLTRPLQRVLNVASAVAGGNLESMVLPRTGPREVVELAGVVEVLGHNLAAIDAHARALAEGRLDDAALPVSLPGGIGSLLQLTMERLAGETARLAHRARHDPLTGLLNRGAILDELAHAARAGHRTDGALVAFVDLDGFKSVNDEHGHELGDELLVAVAERLRVIPCPATHVGRLGGDEFVAVCRYPSNSAELARSLLDCFDAPFLLSTGPMTLKASIGVALCPSGSDPRDGLRRADQATYRAKRNGKGQLVMA